MAKIKKVSLADKLNQMKSHISANAAISNLPDIITFCESKDYLGISLFPVQKIILKCFYRGTKGNENVKLTQEEISLCEGLGLNSEQHGYVLQKYDNKELFKELVLILGRRSGKDFIASVIAVYEACRLLEIEGGDPYKFYDIDPANPIVILTIATASDQAEISYKEIKGKILNSKYFEDKYISDGIGTDKIYLLTPKDKADNIYYASKKLPLKRGSIVIEAGHSNSKSLLGRGVIVAIFDEVASYQLTGGSSSGSRLYSSIEPALATYNYKRRRIDESGNPILDDNGNEIFDIIYDGKSVSISSPRGKEGILYDKYTNDKNDRNMLLFKLPTWVVNPKHTESSLRLRFNTMSEEDFIMEFGAEFSGTAGTTFFNKDSIDKVFTPEINLRNIGETGKVYFVHLDPATTSNNYALVVLHREDFYNKDLKQMDLKIIVDHIKYWHPTPNKPVNLDEIDEYIVNLKHRFYIGLLTYDAMNDLRSINKLKKIGIPHKMTRFNSRFTMMIYTNLYNLINSGRIIIPEHKLLKDEMTNLQKRVTEKGYKVIPKSSGDIKTNDIVDCLAGACFQALNKQVNELPTGRIIHTPYGKSNMSNTTFNSMQGTPYILNPNNRKMFNNNHGTILPKK